MLAETDNNDETETMTTKAAKRRTPTERAITDVQIGLMERYEQQPWKQSDPRHGVNSVAELAAIELTGIALAAFGLSEFGTSSDKVLTAALAYANDLARSK